MLIDYHELTANYSLLVGTPKYDHAIKVWTSQPIKPKNEATSTHDLQLNKNLFVSWSRYVLGPSQLIMFNNIRGTGGT